MNRNFYLLNIQEDLDYDNTIALLKALESGNAKVGSQIGRNQAEGELGRTSLKNGMPPPPPCRDFDQLKKEWEENQAK